MFNFDISQTKVGQELFEEGEKKGEKKAAKKLITKLMAQKFGIKMNRIAPRLRSLRTQDLMALGENLLAMNTFEDAHQWIKNRKKMIKVAA